MRRKILLAQVSACLIIYLFSVGTFAIKPANSPGDKETAIPAWKENAKSNARTSPLEPTQQATPGATDSGEVSAATDFTIALDIGHSVKKGGAISARGVSEYEFNRRLVDELFQKLQSSPFVRPFVINPGREEISLPKRATQANEQNADLFLAIHHDSVKEGFLKKWEFDGKTRKYCDDFHGYSIFISQKNPKPLESLGFATALGRALLKAGFTPTLHHVAQENRLLLDKEKGIYAFDDLIVLKTAAMPAVLLECGVIVNRNEEEKLNDPIYRNRLTEAISDAIESVARAPAR
jgi:N-acetylmuramoyl-L-alanine amidase